MDKKELKRVENILRNYNIIKMTIKNQLMEIESIEKTYEGCSGISYEERTGNTYKITSSVENEIVQKEKKIKELENEIIANQKIITLIDNGLALLASNERKLIELRYFSRNPISWDKVGYQLGFNGDYCRTRLRNRIMKHMYYIVFVNPYKQYSFNDF